MKKLYLWLLVVFAIFAIAFTPIAEYEVTSEFLVMATGSVVSLAFSWLPFLNTWYAGKTEKFKKNFMLLMLLLTTAGLYAGMCFDLLTLTGMACDAPSGVTLLYYYLLAVIANQSVFKITPQADEVVLIKESLK